MCEPYLGHSLLHSSCLCLLYGNLEPFRLAGTFWIGGRITDGTIGSLVHVVASADFKPHLCALLVQREAGGSVGC